MNCRRLFLFVVLAVLALTCGYSLSVWMNPLPTVQIGASEREVRLRLGEPYATDRYTLSAITDDMTSDEVKQKMKEIGSVWYYKHCVVKFDSYGVSQFRLRGILERLLKGLTH